MLEVIKKNQSDPKEILALAVKREFEKSFRYVFGPAHQDLSMNKIPGEVRGEIARFINQIRCPNLQGLLMMGAVGCGKTSAMAIIYRERLNLLQEYVVENFFDGDIDLGGGYLSIYKNNRCCIPAHMIDIGFITHSNLIKRLRKLAEDKEYDNYAHDYTLEKRILMIDDFGRGYEDQSGWNLSLQEEFFDHRWTNRKTLVLTTNYTGKNLRELKGWERIVDRIVDPAFIQPVIYPGGSRRV